MGEANLRRIVCKVIGNVGRFDAVLWDRIVGYYSCGQLAPIEKIQLRAARIFLGV